MERLTEILSSVSLQFLGVQHLVSHQKSAVEKKLNLIPLDSALDDFTVVTGLPPTFSPNPDTNNPCIQINLEDDTLVEENEYFMVQLNDRNEAINVPENPTARVMITDDDGKPFLFYNNNIMFNCGGQLMHRFLILLAICTG